MDKATREARMNELLERKQEITDAFALVLDVISMASDMGDNPPPGVTNYLWNKWFKLEGLEIR